MKIIALISGGKDSIFAMHCAHALGHEIVGIATLVAPDEKDSWMYQTVCTKYVELISQCLNLPFYSAPLKGKPVNTQMDYDSNNPIDEVEDLYNLLSSINIEYEGVCSGAILSTYQYNRVNHVCQRLNIHSLSPLWQWPRGEVDLLEKILSICRDAIFVKIASFGLDDPSLLGERIIDHLPRLNKIYNSIPDGSFHIIGEGGEYESFVLDCPLFKNRRIRLSDIQIKDNEGDVYYIYEGNLQLISKDKEDSHWELDLRKWLETR